MKSNLARKLAPAPAAAPSVHSSPRLHARRDTGPAAQEKRPLRHLVLATTLLILVGINAVGAGYYAAPMSIRVRHSMHEWLRPSGKIGQGAGILALAIFVFLWLYPLRKRFKSLAWTGSVGRWLDVHVTAALTLPLLLAIHAAWRFDGVIGLGYTAMLLVCASGVVGRYLYSRIPRAKSGVELTRDEVAAQRASLIDRISATTGLEREMVERSLQPLESTGNAIGIGRSLGQLIAGDVLRWRKVRQLRRNWTMLAPPGRRPSNRSLDEAVRLATREIALAQQARLLGATHQVFRWWHVAHRPFALTALIAVVVHVAVVIAVGATWLG